MKFKALILCGGMGERLKPLTDTTPKCLIEVGGKPVLQHILEHLKKHDITEVAINTHWLSDSLIRWGGNNLIFSYEPELLGTAGTIRRWIPWLGENFLVLNGDTLTDLDIKDFMDFHLRWDELASISRDPQNWKCTGAMAFNKMVRGLLPETGMIDDILPDIPCAEYYKCPGYWDIGTPSRLETVRRVFKV